MASPSAGAPALKYGDINTETASPGEAKGLIIYLIKMKNDKEFFDLFKQNFKDKIYIGYAFNKSDIQKVLMNYKICLKMSKYWLGWFISK